MPTAILIRSQLKVTCCNADLAPCILQKVRDIHKRTLVGHSFIELFFELSHKLLDYILFKQTCFSFSFLFSLRVS